MRYAELLRTLTEEPLLITAAAHASLLRLFHEHRTLEAIEFRAKREGIDLCGNEVELDQMEIDEENALAMIPIGGPVGIGFGKFEKGAGAVDLADVTADLAEANRDNRVTRILLNIDSPGGMVSGTPEFADKILASTKPVYAFTSGSMASAAYWIGSSAERILATKSADIGSIGVYSFFLDSVQAMAGQGLKVDVIASDPYKGMGIPGTALSDQQRKFMQDRVNGIANMFKEHVITMRGGTVDPDDMRGQAFIARDAQRKGLIDDLVADRNEAVDIIKTL